MQKLPSHASGLSSGSQRAFLNLKHKNLNLGLHPDPFVKVLGFKPSALHVLNLGFGSPNPKPCLKSPTQKDPRPLQDREAHQ